MYVCTVVFGLVLIDHLSTQLTTRSAFCCKVHSPNHTHTHTMLLSVPEHSVTVTHIRSNVGFSIVPKHTIATALAHELQPHPQIISNKTAVTQEVQLNEKDFK